MVIDFHAHVFPDLVQERLSTLVSPDRISAARQLARKWLRPISTSLHESQTALRHLPESARRITEQVGGLIPLAGLLVESSPSDLLQAMDQSGVDHCVIIAHPPSSPNEMVLELASENPRLHAAVNIPPGTRRPGFTLKKFAQKGAKILKIHPAADGEDETSKLYDSLLHTASDLAMPVIVHTGEIHCQPLYKDPKLGDVKRFTSWFKEFQDLKFVLAHMNFHEPGVAMDIAEEHANVLVDTSWQPAEIIGESVRRLGPERVLFASDWPLMGQNMQIGLARIRDCVETGLITEDESRLILSENAMKLLAFQPNESEPDAPAP